MKIFVGAIIGIMFINSCTCDPNSIEQDAISYMDIHGKGTRKLSKIDGKTTPPDDPSMDHACPLRNCWGTHHPQDKRRSEKRN